MYENITYAELKKLPRDEKAEAWKELLSLSTTRKELAEKLGVSPAVVYNMVSRYAADKPVDAADESKLETTVIQEAKKVRAKRGRKVQKPDNISAIREKNDLQPENAGNMPDSARGAFSIVLSKIVSGEDAQFFLNGIGSTLLKSQKYNIEVKITEK